jgi:enoyl-[acyl-carrier protein] reductase I
MAKNGKVALIMGVANRRSIAWACVRSFLRRQHEEQYDVIVTTQTDKLKERVQRLATEEHLQDRVLGVQTCSVGTEIERLFQEKIPDLLKEESRPVDAVVHSVAFASLKGTLSSASWEDYQQAQRVSAYSFLETARCLQKYNKGTTSSGDGGHPASLTALSHLGAVRAVPNYHIMGPAKAALEAIARGLAAELGPDGIRVNCVSAGPVRTAAAAGIPGFGALAAHCRETAPLRRLATAEEIAETVQFLASDRASGVTGQTIYCDAGYSSVVPVVP